MKTIKNGGRRLFEKDAETGRVVSEMLPLKIKIDPGVVLGHFSSKESVIIMSTHNITIHMLLLSFVMTLGCSRGPSRLHMPSISASSAGSEAIEMYDADKDGRISGAELDKCPALKAAMAQIDKTGEGAITADMITERIKAWQNSKLGRMSLRCTVLHNGRPLPNAEVRLMPEKFLGENVKTAQGKTDRDGMAMLSVETTDRSDRPGVTPGLYRVEITKAGENIPAKYNTETTLGQEVALDAVGVREGIRFNLAY